MLSSSYPATVTHVWLAPRDGTCYISFELNNGFLIFLFYFKQGVVSSKLLPVVIIYLLYFSIDEIQIEYSLKVAETEF